MRGFPFWRGAASTIRICIIADGKVSVPTDCQLKRTAALAEELARRCDIPLSSIHYPANWQM